METVRGKWEGDSLSTTVLLRNICQKFILEVFQPDIVELLLCPWFWLLFINPHFQNSAVHRAQTGGNSENRISANDYLFWRIIAARNSEPLSCKP